VQELSKAVQEQAAQVRLLALDSDGVLTDGGVYVFEDGQEFRRFNIKDGLGIKALMEAGIEIIIISGAKSPAVMHRAKTLGIKEVHVGIEDKLTLLRQLCEMRQLSFQQLAYMGDDLPDLPILEVVGFPAAPADAHEKVLARVLFVSAFAGGHGAVRELADTLIACRNRD
jgi:3-deoxy-D-manno-octulosonate 8-phosphate phosphatase (KDO 8-P phosphatase)